MKHLSASLCCVACLLFSGLALAAEAASVPDKPIRITERNTPVAVEYEGNDSLGARLNTRIKEILNASNLFALKDEDGPKIRLLISTVPEFSSRPGLGSAYAIVWAFSQKDANLRHYLAREVGVFTADEINDIAAKIVERTDTLAVRYGYLFN